MNSPAAGSRLSREKRTIEAMIFIYCRRNHNTHGALCEECQTLLEYSLKRLDACRYGENKPACSDCSTHCYSPAMREKVKEVMRFAGPRMLVLHPYLALLHYMDRLSWRKL